MAIDDNTSYELTGYQVKDLAGRIRQKADSASLAPVATSGLYSDITGAPTVPTVYNGKLTITQNGKTIGEFTANQSTDTTIDLAGGVYADDPTAPANPDGWITGNDMSPGTFQYVDYSSENSITLPYTATKNQMVIIAGAGNTGQGFVIRVNGSRVFQNNLVGAAITGTFYIKAGDVVSQLSNGAPAPAYALTYDIKWS